MKQVAARTDLSCDTLRYQQKIGLLQITRAKARVADHPCHPFALPQKTRSADRHAPRLRGRNRSPQTRSAPTITLLPAVRGLGRERPCNG